MKKYIFTESQIKSIIDDVVNEQIGGLQCTTQKLKNIVQGKFNVASIDGSVRLNGKVYDSTYTKPILLLPETEIKLCISNFVYLTNGYTLFWDNGKIGYQKSA